MSSDEITTLHGLLALLFDEDELRQFVGELPYKRNLKANLPGPGTTRNSLALAAQELLRRHGLIDTDLFARLKDERPKRRAAINRVQVRILEHAPAKQDEETDRLTDEIQQVTTRIERLAAAGASNEVDAANEERKGLKRQLREGRPLKAGNILGDRYLLMRRIGKGGFATVWEAIDQAQNDHVAVKVLHSDLAGGKVQRQRFFRGARIMAELDHPAVVRIREPHAEDGGFCYFVMDYLPSGDLHKKVLSGHIHRDDAIPIILRVGEALAMAYQHGYVHRDVKPANILLSDTNEPFLTDFDLVAAQDTTGGTRTGALGTITYMPPEMLSRAQDADARADVYGLGMTTVFVIHGADLPPHVMRDAATFIRGIDCSPAVAAVLRQATTWERNARYSDAGVFCNALTAAAEVERLLRRYREGQRDFQESDLRGANLTGADLAHADLTGADLTGANLRGTDLTNADLTGTNLKSALYDVRTCWPKQFRCETPMGSSVEPTKAPFIADILPIMVLADLCGADLTNADLTNANLAHANLARANLARADLSRANLPETDLRGANLRETDLREANLSNANLTGANLTGANLTGANLARADLSRADLSRANLPETNLSQANLRETDLSRADLAHANLFVADFTGANLRGTNLTNAYLRWANFSNANLSMANFSVANLRGVAYDHNTVWPNLIDPTAHGAVKIGSNAE